ncbi:pantoate--beta-alanine ligase [Desulforudis sp. 1088]|uniref:pantoate--beta-alanine ligase n=1 Tax=unclassified Candidatus Desulforudis TaxID=2635950 RepID=UPI003CE57546
MRVLSTVSEVRKVVQESQRPVGLVPTMGFFHEGHLSLMRAARETCATVVVSIFVNPLQFGPREDLDAYPRDLPRDLAMAEGVGVDLVFAPGVQEMYPERQLACVEVEKISEGLCGAKRPGHFRGVATVVAKLFNIVQPDAAFFGQKDAQQLQVIRRMVQDLNFPVTIVPCPIVREPDGLAMSSRNVYLTPEERRAAVVLYRSLKRAENLIAGGEHDAGKIESFLAESIASEPLARLDYAEVRALPDLAAKPVLSGEVILAVAAHFGRARLIDNLIVRV